MRKRVALVTGAANGIGKATVKLFRENGWIVYGIDKVKSKDKNIFQVDLSDMSQIIDFCKEFNSLCPRLDTLVNNAAVQFNSPISDLPIDEWQKTFAVNMTAPFLLSKLLLPSLKKAKGAIVNISSVHAKATSNNISAYAASKGALSAFTRACAIEYAKYGIRVNAILPGAVETKMLGKSLKTNRLSSNNQYVNPLLILKQKHPLKAILAPKEIANIIFIFSSLDSSKNLTGQEFIVDGGILSKLTSE